MFAAPNTRLLATRWLDGLVAWAAGLNRRRAWAVSLAMMLATVLIDWLTGPDLSMNAIYIVPICLAAWSLGLSGGLMIGAIFAFATFGLSGFGDGFAVHAEHLPLLVAGWNTAMRIGWVAVVVVLVSGFRRSYDLQRRRARTDDLTGALTKHAFGDHLNRAIAASGRRGFSLVLVYSDLDGFKAINDRHGHGAGDRVLVAFADAAGRAIRGRDVLARMGGDEFIMLLTVSSADDGFAAAERLHRTVGAALAELPYPVTASMGAIIVERPWDGDPSAFMAMADALMYEVKRAGKNALRIAYVDRPAPMPDMLAEAA